MAVPPIHLREHVGALLREMDRRYEQRFEAQKEAVTLALTAQQTLTSAALVAHKEAVIKAEVAADKRFELLNELRSGVATKETVEALEKRLNDLAARIDKTEGRSGGLSAGWGYLLGAIIAISAIVGLVVNLSR